MVTTDDPSFGGRVFYEHNGIRHWVVSASYFAVYGFLWPDDVNSLPVDQIRSLKPGGPLPWPWTESDMTDPPKRDWTSLRELSCCTLRGRGIEFGAGTAPLCLPPGCQVEFADFFSKNELRDRSYESQLQANAEFVELAYITTIEEIIGVPDDSLDFIVACHVIEHTRNPVKAIAQSFNRLKQGGKLVLIVPDKRLTFDRARPLTSLEHNIADYMQPDDKRDEEHYYDFCRNVKDVSDDKLEEYVQTAIRTNMDLHFHVWTYDTFSDLILYIQRALIPWTSIWSHPPGTGDVANEFYFVLTK